MTGSGRHLLNKKRTAIITTGVVAILALIVGIAWFGPWNKDDADEAAQSRADGARHSGAGHDSRASRDTCACRDT